MNYEKIGNFISNLRKEKNLTQSDLAQKLHVTDKAISKWENGRCLPDVSIMPALCKELEITLNDLLSGEIVDKNEYQKTLENNIKYTLKDSKKKIENKNKIITGILFSIIMALIITFSIFIAKSINDLNYYKDENYGKSYINYYTDDEKVNQYAYILKEFYKNNREPDYHMLAVNIIKCKIEYDNYIPFYKNENMETEILKLEQKLKKEFIYAKNNNLDYKQIAKELLKEQAIEELENETTTDLTNYLDITKIITDLVLLMLYIGFAIYFIVTTKYKTIGTYIKSIFTLLIAFFTTTLMYVIINMLIAWFYNNLDKIFPYYGGSAGGSTFFDYLTNYSNEAFTLIIFAVILNILHNLIKRYIVKK